MIKQIDCFLLSAILLFALMPRGYAEGSSEMTEEEIMALIDYEQFGPDAVVIRDGDGEAVSVNGYPVRPVHARITIHSAPEAFRFAVDFVDYPFWRPATAYDGNLALMSLGMALCANREQNTAQEPMDTFDPALNLVHFFEEAGFSDIREDDYSRETTMYTVSTAMAYRAMEHEGEEPFTLIAVGVCGANYKNEWQSNMTPGSGELHEGFESAANLVIDRISGYIMTHGFKGRIKLWISGFSRAAAVSNLVAGIMVTKEIFPKEDVYAYTFATPAAVLDPPETGYENIFNIISPMDLVPQVMPAEWGFGRYGTDLYIPETEFSSAGIIATYIRGEIAQQTFGVRTDYSPALNLRMRLLFSMLLDLLESREHYNDTFQPAVLGIMQDHNASNLLVRVRDVLLNIRNSDSKDRAGLDRLINYVLRVFGNAFTRTELSGANLNSGSAGIRLFNEHREDAYLANILSIHKNSYESSTECTYVLIRGPVRVRLTSRDDGSIDVQMTDRGEVMTDGDAVYEQLLYMERIGNVSILAVPHDADYRVDWEATADGTVEVRQAVCSVDASVLYPGAASAEMRVRTGDTGVAYEAADGKALMPEGFSAVTYHAQGLASFLGIASLGGVNWRTACMGITALLGIALSLIIFLIRRVTKKGGKTGLINGICLTVFSVTVLETEMAYWFFADRIILCVFWKALTGAVLLILFFRLHEPTKPLLRTEFPGLLTAVLADILIRCSFVPGVLAFLVCHALLAVCFLRRAPIRWGKWAQWAAVSLAVSGLIVWRYVPGNGTAAWAAALYAPVLLLMSWSAGGLKIRIRYAARMLLISDVLMGIFMTASGDPAIHAVYMLLFYLALLLMACGRETDARGDRSRSWP